MRPRTRLLCFVLTVTATVFVLSGCASDKKVPHPPDSFVIDVTQPVDLTDARKLLESAAIDRGEARKVDAFHSAQRCSEVAAFYAKYMPSAYWKSADRVSLSGASSGFTQAWRYASRTVVITGAPAANGSGCTVMIGDYRRSGRDRYQTR